MNYYSGLDVSLKETFISIIDDKGLTVKEGFVPTDVGSISSYLKEGGLTYDKIGIESGQLSISLCKGLIAQGLSVTCVDARHMAAALSARINKNDRNDARGIAQMMRAGLYKEVQVKSDESCQLKVLLGSRRQLVSNRQQLKGTIRGLLKIYGVKLTGKDVSGGFGIRVRQVISPLGQISCGSISALLESLEAIEESLTKLDKMLSALGQKDEDCQRLMTIPGVGAITAMTYKAAVDNPDRFERSETVGAYMGLTPRQYASGEVDRHGSISKMGPQECRNMLYEAAFSLLVICKTKSKLKTWGLKLVKKKGMKKAVVAVARKLAVIMNRMLVTKTAFCPQ
jgi:transposase